MHLFETDIYIALTKLRKLTYEAQFLMSKADRIIYGTPLMQSIGNAIKYFSLAFTIKNPERIRYMNECFGHFQVFRVDMQFVQDENIIKYKKRKPKVKTGTNSSDYENAKKIEMLRLIAKVDENIGKYRASLIKGKNALEY